MLYYVIRPRDRPLPNVEIKKEALSSSGLKEADKKRKNEYYSLFSNMVKLPSA